MKINKKKIIRACTASQSLGFCRDIMLKMKDMGYELVAVSSPGDFLKQLHDEDGIKTIAVPMARHISLISDFMSVIKMIRVFVNEKPQVVHSMTPKAGLVCMVAGWLTGVPIRIHTFTGLVWPTSKGLKRKILMATDWLTCACATHVIPEGKGVMCDLINGGITKKSMKVLGYGNVKGIDLEKFNPKRFSRTQHDTFNFLFIGRIVGDKGINELVEAFTQIYEKYPFSRLTLIGNYEKNLDPLKPDTMKRIQTHPAIIAPGRKMGDDLLQAYMDADCHVMPSYREGFPNTVIEAGAMELPQIVTDINGSREIVSNEKNGLVVPSMNVKALYDAMERMLNDKELRGRLTKNARPMIESRFEKNFVQKCLIDFYIEIIK